MSVLSKVTLKNLLKELNLEPNWDKWKRYALSAGIAIGLFQLYFILERFSSTCLPADPSVGENSSPGTERAELTVPQAAYVNKRCSRYRDLNLVQYSSYTVLVYLFVQFLFSIFWLYGKSIGHSLRNFHKARRLTEDSILTLDEKKALCSGILSSDNGKEDTKTTDDQRKMREICLLVTVNGPKRILSSRYRCSSIFLMVYCILFIVVFVIYFIMLLGITPTFYCHIEEFAPVSSANGTSPDWFICTTENVVTIGLFTLILIILSIGQIIATYIGLRTVSTESEKYDAKICESLKLLLVLSDHSKKCSQLEELVRFLYSDEYKKALPQKAADVIEKGDYQLIKIKATIFGPTPEMIKHLGDSFEAYPADAFPSNKYIEVMKAPKYLVNDKSTTDLATKLKETEKWELLVHLLENSSLKYYRAPLQDRVPLARVIVSLKARISCKEPEINNEPEQPQDKISELCKSIPVKVDGSTSRERCSILYYAFAKEHFSGRNKLAAAKLLCKDEDLTTLEVIENLEPQANNEQEIADGDKLRECHQKLTLTDYLEKLSYSQKEIEQVKESFKDYKVHEERREKRQGESQP